MEKSKGNDTLMLWIVDSLVLRQDTITLKMDYLKTDSLNLDQVQTDTLSLPSVTETEPQGEGREREKRESGGAFPGDQHNIRSAHEIYLPVQLEFEQPVIDFDSSKVRLMQVVDSVSSPIPFTVTGDTLNPRKYSLRHKWEPGGKYSLAIDSAAIHSIYGLWNNKVEQVFYRKDAGSVRQPDDSSVWSAGRKTGLCGTARQVG
jgi:hypothetical protein